MSTQNQIINPVPQLNEEPQDPERIKKNIPDAPKEILENIISNIPKLESTQPEIKQDAVEHQNQTPDLPQAQPENPNILPEPKVTPIVEIKQKEEIPKSIEKEIKIENYKKEELKKEADQGYTIEIISHNSNIIDPVKEIAHTEKEIAPIKLEIPMKPKEEPKAEPISKGPITSADHEAKPVVKGKSVLIKGNIFI